MSGALQLPVSHLDPAEMRESKTRLLKVTGYPEEYLLNEGDGVPMEALYRARMLCMDEIEMYKWNPLVTKEVGYVSHWNELKAVRMLETAVKKMNLKSLEADLRKKCERMYEEEEDPVCEEINNEKYVKLREFLAKGGMREMAVSPANYPQTTGRGLVFTRDVHHPEPIVSVPRKLLFNAEQVTESTLCPAFDALQLDDDTRLILFLMHEKFGGPGKWEAFVSLLPEKYSTLFFWDDAELSELNGSRLLPEALSQKEHLRSVYDDLFPRLTEAYPTLFPAAVFTFNHMLWARAVFDSRGFVINLEGKQLTTLIPWAEYINHTSKVGHVSFRRFDTETQCMLLESLGTSKKGTQARMNYGPMQNSELLMSYGFAEEKNAIETCVVEVELDEDDELYEAKQMAVEALHIPTPHLLHYVEKDTEHPYHYLMAVLRVVVADSLDTIAACTKNSQCIKGPVSNENEEAAKETFIWLVEQLLGEYPTSLEDDMLILQRVRSAQETRSHTEVCCKH